MYDMNYYTTILEGIFIVTIEFVRHSQNFSSILPGICLLLLFVYLSEGVQGTQSQHNRNMVEKLLTKFGGKFRVHVTNNNVGKPMLKYILYITICDLACFYFGLNTNEMSIFFEYTNNYKYTILSLCCRKNDDKIHGCTSDHFWVRI